jgi:hypothetical protein
MTVVHSSGLGPVIGKGGFVFTLEKRSYDKVLPHLPTSRLTFQAGPCTPELMVEDLEVVRQLYREFLRPAADVMQAKLARKVRSGSQPGFRNSRWPLRAAS